MDAKTIFGWNLRKIRVAKGFTQEKLANNTGIDRAYLGRGENGKENITIGFIDRVATDLQVEIEELFKRPAPDETMPNNLKAGRHKGS
jgi:transcriptional regulator with XRE-family HTH domain